VEPHHDGWHLARLHLRVADGNFHEHCQHNYRHHFLAEAFALSTRRQLSRRHPIHLLLEPHIDFTLVVNYFVLLFLRKGGGYVERTFSATLPHVRRMMRGMREELPDWQSLQPESDLRRRGMHPDANDGLDYFWRDDAIRWFEAIRQFTTQYVNGWYSGNEEILADEELQSWASELGSSDGGNIPGFPRIQTREALADVLATMLYIVGPEHASVHFPLVEYRACVAAYPSAAYQAPDAEKPRLEATVPPMRRGALQFLIGQFLGYRYRQFGVYGNYRLGRIDSEEVESALAGLTESLEELEGDIKERSESGRGARPYEYLRPTRVPNSINL
jgi:arachidonate 15-lipoxygenase